MKESNSFVGVILAAGSGSRMGDAGKEYPKPMQKIGSHPIIYYHICYLRKLEIKEVIIVVGYLGGMIKQYLGNGESFGIKIRYIEQKERLGIAHAVQQLEYLIDLPFILFLGDIFFIPRNLSKMLEIYNKKQARAVLAIKIENNPYEIQKSFSVLLSNNSLVRRVIEKPRYILTNRKGCGVYLFDPIIFDFIRQTPRTAMRDEYEITTAIQKLIDGGYPVYDAEVIKWDINVTFPEDIKQCNDKLKGSKLIT